MLLLVALAVAHLRTLSPLALLSARENKLDGEKVRWITTWPFLLSPNFHLPFPPLSLFEDSEGCGYDRRTQGQCAGSLMPTGTRVTL